uniref:Unannotated protein n=1 Tax=freshwater metagenome TaxID=449393 RepID=A0A6J7Q273_9ZZZZ
MAESILLTASIGVGEPSVTALCVDGHDNWRSECVRRFSASECQTLMYQRAPSRTATTRNATVRAVVPTGLNPPNVSEDATEPRTSAAAASGATISAASVGVVSCRSAPLSASISAVPGSTRNRRPSTNICFSGSIHASRSEGTRMSSTPSRSAAFASRTKRAIASSGVRVPPACSEPRSEVSA